MTTVPLVPRQVLFGNPERVSPHISPDGRRMAWIAPDEGVLNVWVNEVGAPLERAVPVTKDRDRGIRSFFWAHDNRHLLYVQDVGGDEDWHLFSVDLDAGSTADLTPFEGVQARVDETDKRFPDTIHRAVPSWVKAMGEVVRESSCPNWMRGRHSSFSVSRTMTTMPPSGVGVRPARTLKSASARNPMKPGFSTIFSSSPLGRSSR